MSQVRALLGARSFFLLFFPFFFFFFFFFCLPRYHNLHSLGRGPRPTVNASSFSTRVLWLRPHTCTQNTKGRFTIPKTQRPTTDDSPATCRGAVAGCRWWSPRPKRRSWARLNFCDQRLGRRPSFHRNVERDFRRNYMFTIPCRFFFWSARSLRIKKNCYYFRIPQSRGLPRGFPQVNLFQVLTVWPIFCTESKPVILEAQAAPQSFPWLARRLGEKFSGSRTNSWRAGTHFLLVEGDFLPATSCR